jgi:hypothetical protein
MRSWFHKLSATMQPGPFCSKPSKQQARLGRWFWREPWQQCSTLSKVQVRQVDRAHQCAPTSMLVAAPMVEWADVPCVASLQAGC